MCVQFNDDAKMEEGNKELAGTIKTIEFKNTRSGFKCCGHEE